MRLLITGAWRATDDMLNELRTAGHTLYFHKQSALGHLRYTKAPYVMRSLCITIYAFLSSLGIYN